MIIEIEGRLYLVTEEGVNTLFDRIEQFTLEQYAKLPEIARVAGQAATRTFLAYAYRHEKDPEKRNMFKVPDRAHRKNYDPTVHVMHMLISYIKIGLMYIEARIETDENRIITAVQLQGTSGRYFPAHGDPGERKNDSGQNDRQHALESISIS